MHNQTIKEVSYTPTLTLSLDTKARKALKQIVSGVRYIIVVDMGFRPLGVLPKEALSRMSTSKQYLADYQEDWEILALTNENTPLRIAVQGAALDPSIAWYVVLDGDVIIGAIPLSSLWRTLIRSEIANEKLDEEEEESLEATESSSIDIFGDPVAPPPNLCYCCIDQPSHCISAEAVERRDARGRALCPTDGTIMIVENPCQKKV